MTFAKRDAGYKPVQAGKVSGIMHMHPAGKGRATRVHRPIYMHPGPRGLS